jgi:hypothetical protein
VINEAGDPIQKACLEKVVPEEKQERADEQGKPIPDL